MDRAQLEMLLTLRSPDQSPEATLAGLLGRSASSVPATAAGHRPASGLLGPPVPPGTALVGRATLARDHRGAGVAAFAVVTPGARPGDPPVARLVLVTADWSAGLPGGRAGARVVAEELDRAVSAAFAPDEPAVRPDVSAVTADLFAIRLTPRDPSVLVAPVLHTPGFAWFAQPAPAAAAWPAVRPTPEPGRLGAVTVAALLAAVLAVVVGGWGPVPVLGTVALAVAAAVVGAARLRPADHADP